MLRRPLKNRIWVLGIITMPIIGYAIFAYAEAQEQTEKSQLSTQISSLKDSEDRLKPLLAKLEHFMKDIDTTVGPDKVFDTIEERNAWIALQLKRQITSLKNKQAKLSSQIIVLEKKEEKLRKESLGLEKEMRKVAQGFSITARQNKLLREEAGAIHYDLGVFYIEKEEYMLASKEFEKAIEINPEDSYAHYNLGYIYADNLKDSEKAVSHFQEFLRLAEKGDEDVKEVKEYLFKLEPHKARRR